MIGENQNEHVLIPSVWIIRSRGPDFHEAEVFGGPPNLTKSTDERFDFGIAGPRWKMDGYDRAFLGSDAIGRDGPVRPGEEHAETDQTKGPDQHPEACFDDGIQRFFGGLHGNEGAWVTHTFLGMAL